jgi:hypothetical protein
VILKRQFQRLPRTIQIVKPDVSMTTRANRQRKASSIRRQPRVSRVQQRLLDDSPHVRAMSIDPDGTTQWTRIVPGDEHGRAFGGNGDRT